MSKTGTLHHIEIYVSDLKQSTDFWGWFLRFIGQRPIIRNRCILTTLSIRIIYGRNRTFGMLPFYNPLLKKCSVLGLRRTSHCKKPFSERKTRVATQSSFKTSLASSSLPEQIGRGIYNYAINYIIRQSSVRMTTLSAVSQINGNLFCGNVI